MSIHILRVQIHVHMNFTEQYKNLDILKLDFRVALSGDKPVF